MSQRKPKPKQTGQKWDMNLGRDLLGRRGSEWEGVEWAMVGLKRTKLHYTHVWNRPVKEKENVGLLFCNYTYSLFFSLTLAPFLSSSSATCFLLGCKEATAQCCNTNKIQLKKSKLLFKHEFLNEIAAGSYLQHCNLKMHHDIMMHFTLLWWSIFPLNILGAQTK